VITFMPSMASGHIEQTALDGIADGMLMGWPMPSTKAPRCRPSVLSMLTARTVSSPVSCCTPAPAPNRRRV
jgi:hypothetical protein